MLVIGVTETSVCLSIITNVKLYLMYLTTHEAACYNTCVCLFLGLSVCQMITFESLDIESLYLHIRYISREYGSRLYIKVIGVIGSQEQKKSKIPIPSR